MNYIVFDLEWNQNPAGKKTRNDKLPFEIIEIGAVKVNSKKEITDSFHRLIKPQVYNWIHDSIHKSKCRHKGETSVRKSVKNSKAKARHAWLELRL